MKKLSMKFFTYGVLSALILCTVPAQALMILNFDSSEQSWVGQGQSFTVTPDDGYIFTGEMRSNNSLRFGISSLNSPFGPDWNPGSGEEYHYWTLSLAAPFNQILETGLYENTARYPFQEEWQPGLTFSGDHRGNNRNGGFFEVLEIGFDLAGNLSAFAVNFTQYGEQNPDWWLTGQLRFNSDIPLEGTTVPEPSSISLVFTGAIIGGLLLRKRAHRIR